MRYIIPTYHTVRIGHCQAFSPIPDAWKSTLRSPRGGSTATRTSPKLERDSVRRRKQICWLQLCFVEQQTQKKPVFGNGRQGGVGARDASPCPVGGRDEKRDRCTINRWLTARDRHRPPPIGGRRAAGEWRTGCRAQPVRPPHGGLGRLNGHHTAPVCAAGRV